MLCGEDTSDFVYNENLGFLDENEWTEIHWFEFCMTILPEKLYPLYDSFTNGTGADFQEDMYQSCICNKQMHPIDYIYEQFKKLKINKLCAE